MASFDDFLADHRANLLGHCIMQERFGVPGIDPVYPPTALSEENLEELKSRLNNLMPTDNMISDLRDWDIQIDAELSADWYFDTIFGLESSIEANSEALAEFFCEKCEEYRLDYNQYESPDEFRALVLESARNFVRAWRKNALDYFANKVIDRDSL